MDVILYWLGMNIYFLSLYFIIISAHHFNHLKHVTVSIFVYNVLKKSVNMV